MKAKNAFECLRLPVRRTEKPRDVGLNWFIDWGWDLARVEGVLQSVGQHIDVVKMPALSLRLLERDFLRKKLELYARHDVKAFPGGMLTEAALVCRRVEDFLAEAKDLGVTVIEVSESEVRLVPETKLRLIEMAAREGFKVLGELGPHHAEQPFVPGEVIRESKACLEAGAWKIILEGEVLNLMKPWEDAGAEGKICQIVEAVGVGEVFFEMMGGVQLVSWAVAKFGPDVNVGNVGHDQAGVMRVEHIRRGIRGGASWYGRFASL
jgi:phosphosulfolactate synthase (CoM biosynthesis protein A)